jgi:hypothetical protein
MPVFSHHTELKGAIAAFGRRGVNNVVRDAFGQAGDFWAQNFLPRHFFPAASGEYGYAKRKGEGARPGSKLFARTAGPAEKAAGEIRPLVYRGDLQRGARTYRVQAVATTKKCSATIFLPRCQGANRRGRNAKHIDMARELTTISEKEKGLLVFLLNEEIDKGLQQLQDKRTL